MSRFIALLLVLLCSRLASAGIINMEFKFTPYLGDPAKADQVEVVAGKASVFINSMCAAMALSMAYPQRMVVVRKPSGGWEEAY